MRTDYYGVKNLFVDSALVTQYANQLKGLTLQQAELALSTKMLTNEQKQQILAESGLIATQNTIQAELLQTTLAQAGLNAEKQNAILVQLGLMDANTLELLTQNACTKAALKETLALHGVTGAQAENIISTLGLSGANTTATVSFELLGASIKKTTAALWAFLTTNPVGWATIAGVALAGLVLGVNAYNKKQEELQQSATESAQSYKSQAESMEDLVSQYEAILDSEKTDAEKTVELNKWKQTLTDTYKIEREELRRLNTDREYGIKLLEDEIDATNRRNRNRWLGENKEEIDKAIAKINSSQIGAFTIDDKSIYDNIKQYVENSMSGTYSVIGDNLIEQYDNLEKIIEYFGSKSELSYEENNLLNNLNKEKDKAKEILDTYKENYQTFYQYTAQNLLDSYAVDDKAIENVSQETYEAWKKGLLATANGDKEIEKSLLFILEGQFPDYETYFSDYYKNLSEAQNKFVNSIHVNNQGDAIFAQQISDYIGKLDEQDLSILLTFDENIFAEGLEGVTKKIEEWKKNNPIEVSFDIATYQEQLETVYGNIEKLQDALTKLDENKFDFSGDIQDLIKAFPEYSTEILNASGDAEQLRIVLQGLLNSQPNNLIKSLTALKSSLTSDEDIEAVDNLIKILRNSTSAAQSVDDLTTSLDDLSSAVSKFTKNQDSLTDALEEQKEHGQLSASTIQSLVDAGYAQALVIDKVTGAVTLNTTAYEKLINEKKKEIKLEIARLKVDLINPYKDETAAIADLERSLSTLNAAEREATLIKIANMRASLANSSLTEEQIRQKEQQLAELEAMLASLDAPTFDNSSSKSSSDDPWKDEADSKIKEIQHLEETGIISHEEYINRLDAINQKYFANNEKYLDEYNKYEEEIYKARKDREQDLFDQKIENLDKEKEKALENNNFETAKTVVNTQITETRKRIVELKTSGKQDVDDEIKQLEDDLDDLNDTLNDINSQEYEFKVSLKTNEIDDLDREFEKSGDTSIYDKQIGIYEGLIGDTQDEINRLLDLGYSMDSEEIQSLLDDMNGYSDKIADIWDKQTEIIKDNVDEQIKALDRNIENTGDTSLYTDKVKVYEQAQKDIYDRIEFYRKQGYAEDSQVIKDLKEQWVEYGEAITDTLQEQADAQIEAYSELMDEQKEILEKQKETQDELFDSQITALEKQKEALEDVNEQLEKENTLNEKIKAIEDARNNVYKNRRMVYTVGGGWEIKDRQEDLDKVKEAQKDYSDELRQQEIDKIQDQIDAIEEAKNAFDESIDKQIKAIEESEKSFEDAMKASYEIRKKLDREFIASIVGEDKADEYLTNANVATSDTEKDKQKNNTTSTTGNNTGGTQNNTEYNSSYSNPTEEKSEETKSDEIAKTLSSTDLAIQKMYEMFSNKGAFTRNVTLDQFVSDLENGVLLKPVGANDVFNPNVLDTGKSNGIYNTINNNNSPVFNIDINVNGRDKDDVALANQIADIAEQKVITGLQAFNAGVHNASSTRRSTKR